MLVYDPVERLNARDALKHPYFNDVRFILILFIFKTKKFWITSSFDEQTNSPNSNFVSWTKMHNKVIISCCLFTVILKK